MRFASTLLLPVALMAVCMAYFQLRSLGHYSGATGKRGRFTLRDLLVFFTLIVAVIAFFVVAMRVGERVSIHQRSVTQSLAEWARDYGRISSSQDAIRTGEMLGYVQHYYVVGEGYRSTPEVEAALEAQRKDTVKVFVVALQNYTGQEFSTDSEKWLVYLKSK